MEDKKIIINRILALAIIALVFGVTSLTMNVYLMIHEGEAIDDFEIEQRVCYLPRDCFETEKKYSDQFPGGEIPDRFPVCLVRCHGN